MNATDILILKNNDKPTTPLDKLLQRAFELGVTTIQKEMEHHDAMFTLELSDGTKHSFLLNAFISSPQSSLNSALSDTLDYIEGLK